MSRARPLRPLDAVGLALVAAWLVWVVVSSVLNGRPVILRSTYVVAPLVLVAGVVLGRLAGGGAPEEQGGVSRPHRTWWLDVTLIVFVTALLPGVAWRMAPGPPPLGYANANTAVATQVMVLCGLALLDQSRDRWGQSLLLVLTTASAFAVVHHGSIAGMVVAVPVVLLVLLTLLWRPRHQWWATLLGLASLGAAVVAFLRLATLARWPDAAVRGLSSVRKDLWEVALEVWRAHPFVGAGPGSFAELNPYAVDPDLAAAHSSLLQVGSELGLVGVVLLGLLVLVGYVLATRGRPAAGVLATAAWTALWIHSLIDHLFDYPGLALVAGLVLGWAGATGRDNRAGDRSV